MAEQVADLKCPAGHTVEVHWDDQQRADEWQCPTCLERFHREEMAAAVAENDGAGPGVLRDALRQAGQRAHQRSLVKFGNRKKGDRVVKAGGA